MFKEAEVQVKSRQVRQIEREMERLRGHIVVQSFCFSCVEQARY